MSKDESKKVSESNFIKVSENEYINPNNISLLTCGEGFYYASLNNGRTIQLTKKQWNKIKKM